MIIKAKRTIRRGKALQLASGSAFFLSLAKYPSANATFIFSCMAGDVSTSDNISVNFSDDLLLPLIENLSNICESAWTKCKQTS